MNKEVIKKTKDIFKLIDELNLPTKWDIEKFESYVDGLFSFAKFKAGRLVKMKIDFEVNEKDSWGWMPYRHLLKKGKQAIVKEVDWNGKQFVYLIEFAEKTYTSSKGTIEPTDGSINLYITEKYLK